MKARLCRINKYFWCHISKCKFMYAYFYTHDRNFTWINLHVLMWHQKKKKKRRAFYTCAVFICNICLSSNASLSLLGTRFFLRIRHLWIRCITNLTCFFSAFLKLVMRLQYKNRWIHAFSCLFFASHNSVDWRESFKSHDTRIKGKSTWFFFVHDANFISPNLLFVAFKTLLMKRREITGVQQNTALPTTLSECFSFFNKSFHFLLWKLAHRLWY